MARVAQMLRERKCEPAAGGISQNDHVFGADLAGKRGVDAFDRCKSLFPAILRCQGIDRSDKDRPQPLEQPRRQVPLNRLDLMNVCAAVEIEQPEPACGAILRFEKKHPVWTDRLVANSNAFAQLGRWKCRPRFPILLDILFQRAWPVLIRGQPASKGV